MVIDIGAIFFLLRVRCIGNWSRKIKRNTMGENSTHTHKIKWNTRKFMRHRWIIADERLQWRIYGIPRGYHLFTKAVSGISNPIEYNFATRWNWPRLLHSWSDNLVERSFYFEIKKTVVPWIHKNVVTLGVNQQLSISYFRTWSRFPIVPGQTGKERERQAGRQAGRQTGRRNIYKSNLF